MASTGDVHEDSSVCGGLSYQPLTNGEEAMETNDDDTSQENGNNSSENGKTEETPSLSEQKSIIAPLLNSSLVAGALWYVVDARWLKRWKRYVGLDDDLWSTDYVGSASDNPGPINNSDICTDGALKPVLFDEMDYCLLSGEAWNNFVSWYGISDRVSPIERRVIEIGTLRKLMVEVYGQQIKLCESDEETLITKEFSRTDTFSHVCTVGKEVFQYPAESKCRVWTFLTDYELVTDMTITLDEADVSPGDRIMIERQHADGKWPRATLNNADSGVSSANDLNSSAGAGNTVGQQRSSSNYISSYYSGGSSWYSGNQRPTTPGLCGLSNLGNTCFMNSALQCMSNTRMLTRYLLEEKHVDEINVDNPLGMQGQIAMVYARLLKEIWSGRFSSVSPREFKGVVGRFAPQFSGFAQHDSQELLAFLLDGLHEDLNRIRKKPYVELSDSDGRNDEEVATEAWKAHLKRNDSVIVDMFQGQFKSRLVCPVCNKVSVTFDPFMFLSLPLPIKKTRVIEVTLVYTDPAARPKAFNLSVPKRGTVKHLLQELGKISNIPADQLVCADVYSHRFHKVFRPSEMVSNILDRDVIFAYEVEAEDVGDGDNVTLPVYHREQDLTPRSTYSTYYSYSTPSPTLFGLPFFVTVPRRGTTYEALYEKILFQLSRFVKPERCTPLPEEPATMATPAVESLNSNGSTHGSSMDASDVKQEEADQTDSSHLEQETDNGNGIEADASGSGDEASDDTDAKPSPIADSKVPVLFQLSVVNSYGGTSISKFEKDGHELDLLSHTHVGVDWDDARKKQAYDEEEADAVCENSESEGADAADAVPKKIQLTDCLKLFTTEEQLGEDDPWYCPQCKEHRQAMKKFDIWKLPKVLVVALKRFSYTRQWRDKLDTMVHFPIQGLDLREYVFEPNPQFPAIYDLHAVSNHFGGLGGGHYTAYGLHHDTQKWYDFDDSGVSSITQNELVSQSAYVLFYTRRDVAVPPPAMNGLAGSSNGDASSAGSNSDLAAEASTSEALADAAADATPSEAADEDVSMVDEESADV
ncbi:ubiquitin carboxyl-terminal hydrolase 4-like [Sycon ciliatum]|uniref:ubiquitin carboxyl-terminal hydrolase 4-like n=1 Tax=Sycon ciliatum TaxID=27933 RepID=UPI0031F5F5BB